MLIDGPDVDPAIDQCAERDAPVITVQYNRTADSVDRIVAGKTSCQL